MTQEETLKRIEDEAEQIVEREIGIKPGRSLLTPMDYGECLRCITAGAKSERNKALDEAIEKVKNWYDTESEFPSLTAIVKEISSLKVDL